MNKPELFSESNQATYCPEDNKLRLYVGRVPRDEYLALKAEGWTSTPRQTCDFVAVWTVNRENTAISYAGIIGDEDQSPTDRAADRAERFAGYRDNRRAGAGYQADRFESVDPVHGYQSEARAERSAARHERIGSRAVNMWEKAEYWQMRTSGVISHALHLCKPHVRMGRMKEIETDIRRMEKAAEEYNLRRKLWLEASTDERLQKCLDYVSGHHQYQHPRIESRKASLYYLVNGEDPITLQDARELYLSDPAECDVSKSREYQHLQLRISYERQMIEAAGGMAGDEEIKVGGRHCGLIVFKVNKSSVSGRVTTIEVLSKEPRYRHIECACCQGYYFHTVDAERSSGGAYTPPTAEDIAIVESIKAELKAKKSAGKLSIPLINPTPESARKLQEVINAERKKWASGDSDTDICETTQAIYSKNSNGEYSQCETVEIDKYYRRCGHTRGAVPLFKVRAWVRGSGGTRIIVLTDKPQKDLPEFTPVPEEVTA